MNYKSIQQANIDDAIRHMREAKATNDVDIFNESKEELRMTLEVIKDTDHVTYEKYSGVLDEKM